MHDPRPMGQLGYVEVETQCAERKTSQGDGNRYQRFEEQTTSHEKDYGEYPLCSGSESLRKRFRCRHLLHGKRIVVGSASKDVGP